MAKDFKKFTMYNEPQEAEFYPKGMNTSDGTVFIAHSQEHDERIRKEERERIKEKLIEKITERSTAFDRVDVEVFFAQLEKEL